MRYKKALIEARYIRLRDAIQTHFRVTSNDIDELICDAESAQMNYLVPAISRLRLQINQCSKTLSTSCLSKRNDKSPFEIAARCSYKEPLDAQNAQKTHERIQSWNGFDRLPKEWKDFILSLSLKDDGPWSWCTNAQVKLQDNELTIVTKYGENYYRLPTKPEHFLDQFSQTLEKLTTNVSVLIRQLVTEYIGPWCLKDFVRSITVQDSVIVFNTNNSTSYYYLKG